MRSVFTRRRVAVGAVAAALVIGAGTALAYWTTSGVGSGSALAGTDHGVTVAGNPAAGIYPGGNVAVTSTITNSSATQPQYVASLTVTISVSNAYDAVLNSTGCRASDFTYAANADPVLDTPSNPHTSPVAVDIAAGGHLDVAGKVFMADTGINQDGCKGVTVTLTYAANAS